MALTKVEMVDAIQAHFGFSKTKCTELFEVLLEIIKKSLENGEDVMVSGFGKFCVNDKKERRGRNPATGGGLMLDKRRVITFKCSQGLRKKVDV